MPKTIITAVTLAAAGLAGAAAMALPGQDSGAADAVRPRATVFDPFRIERVPLGSATPRPAMARPAVPASPAARVGGQAATGDVRGQGGYVLGEISRPPLSPFRRPPLGPFRPDPNGGNGFGTRTNNSPGGPAGF